MGIVKELMEIWPNEVYDKNNRGFSSTLSSGINYKLTVHAMCVVCVETTEFISIDIRPALNCILIL